MIDNSFKIKALLSILNSKLISFYHSNTSANAFKGSFPKVLLQDLRDLPIPQINDCEMTILEQFCDKLIMSYKEKNVSMLQTDIEQIKNHIEYLEHKVDELVYLLYGLTDEEIKIVEGK